MLIYADENIEKGIIEGLRRRGVKVVSVQEEDDAGKDDAFLLHKAKNLGAVVLTHDTDFLSLAHRWRTEGNEHHGVLYLHPQNMSIGESIRRIELAVYVLTDEEMRNHIEFL